VLIVISLSQTCQVNDTAHACVARRQSEIRGSLAIRHFEPASVKHGVAQVKSYIHARKRRA
jgi:hypothetical protein